MRKTPKTVRPYSLILLILVIFLSVSRGGPQGRKAEAGDPVHRLVVLHTNDTHGHPLKFNHDSVPGVGGLPARATLVREIRGAEPNVLLLDAGDLNTGRAESNLFYAKPDIEGYNYIGYDAMALGNHEFDNPVSVLQDQMRLANFSFLSANVLTRKGRYLARPYAIKSFPGFRVAVFGLTLRETPGIVNPEHVKDLRFLDEVEVAKTLVPRLRREADLVIALTHLGIYDHPDKGSRRLASRVAGIDLIVDGHSHTYLDSPILVTNPSGHSTPIVQAWKWGLVVGRLDLRMERGKIADFQYRNIPVNLKRAEKTKDGETVYRAVDREISEDKGLLALLQPYESEIESRFSEIIGYAQAPFPSKDLVRSETAIGNLVADSLRWYGRAKDADFAVQNGGGIRSDIPEGPVAVKAIYDLLPFDNTAVLVELMGSDVQRLFDYTATVPAGRGAFPQVSGEVRVTMDPRSRRCEKVLIRGKPLDPKKVYRVVTNSFLARGGDGYRVFLSARKTYDYGTPQQAVLIEYIKAMGGRLVPRVEGRIRMLSAAEQGPLLNRRDPLRDWTSVSTNSRHLSAFLSGWPGPGIL
ncbi:MAG: 5'-nucleotidase C-terminal domain-containing protein [Thermodesulfobacteriota bacterium]